MIRGGDTGKNVFELNNDRMELILVPNDVELNNDRRELILVPNNVELNNDRMELILVKRCKLMIGWS